MTIKYAKQMIEDLADEIDNYLHELELDGEIVNVIINKFTRKNRYNEYDIRDVYCYFNDSFELYHYLIKQFNRRIELFENYLKNKEG